MPLAPAAIAIIFNDTKTEVLLVKRKDVPIWVLPGGGIEADETPQETVKREVFEETGLIVEIERQCAEYYPINRLSAFTSVFVCRIVSGEPCTSSETSGIVFFPFDQLPMHFFEVHRDWLEDALSNPGMVRKSITQVTYWSVIKYFLLHPYQVLRYLWTRYMRD